MHITWRHVHRQAGRTVQMQNFIFGRFSNFFFIQMGPGPTHPPTSKLFLDFWNFFYFAKPLRQCKPKNNTNSYRKLDTTAIGRINTLLLATDLSPLQQLHINDQIDFVNTKLLEYINICAPMKVVKIPAKYVIREKWMTKGLLQSSLNLQKNEKK